MFSVEKAICPYVSSEGLLPTGRKRDGYLKMRRMEDKMKREDGMMTGRTGGINTEGNKRSSGKGQKVAYNYERTPDAFVKGNKEVRICRTVNAEVIRTYLRDYGK